jgi:hypothetical protein
VLAGAVKAAGHDDFGSDSYREPLDVFVTACRDQAELTPFGRLLVAKILQRALANRLALQGWASRHPDVRGQTIASPWVIVGLPRTGTSILEMLLGLDPRARPLLQWETPAYAQHRLALQVLQSRRLTGRWILKTPNHLWHLDALLATYPDARIIWTHRDPGPVVTSLASLANDKAPPGWCRHVHYDALMAGDYASRYGVRPEIS